MLSNAFEQKQYGRIIKLLTGEFPPPWTHMTSRDLTANTSRTQSNAYKLRPPNSSVTTAAAPPPHHSGPLHHENADWDAALTSRPIFRAHFAHLMIPNHLSNIIWEALTDVPNIDTGRSRLQEVFTQPPTYEDYL